jgi:hypothetical protein
MSWADTLSSAWWASRALHSDRCEVGVETGAPVTVAAPYSTVFTQLLRDRMRRCVSATAHDHVHDRKRWYWWRCTCEDAVARAAEASAAGPHRCQSAKNGSAAGRGDALRYARSPAARRCKSRAMITKAPPRMRQQCALVLGAGLLRSRAGGTAPQPAARERAPLEGDRKGSGVTLGDDPKRGSGVTRSHQGSTRRRSGRRPARHAATCRLRASTTARHRAAAHVGAG